jgi:hypothetical protein
MSNTRVSSVYFLSLFSRTDSRALGKEINGIDRITRVWTFCDATGDGGRSGILFWTLVLRGGFSEERVIKEDVIRFLFLGEFDNMIDDRIYKDYDWTRDILYRVHREKGKIAKREKEG